MLIWIALTWWSYLYSYGLYTYALHSYGLCSYDLHSYGLEHVDLDRAHMVGSCLLSGTAAIICYV